MKDITTIIFRLTVSCLLAGLVMGTAFVFTNKAKLHDETKKEEVQTDLNFSIMKEMKNKQ